MKLTYNWLKDFVDIKLTPEALAEKLTMAGLEVKSREKIDDDFIFEIEITSNRPDWLSVVGIAREVAAITNSRVKGQGLRGKGQEQTKRGEKEKRLTIKIEDKKDCPLYAATIIEGVKIAPSPEWMQKRIRAIGLRALNNVVDITNYVLYETGQPLHAFDLDKLIERQSARAPERRLEIVVRRAKKGEEIVSIDGIKRVLDKNILVIADADKPIAIAGIIGGKDTEVDAGTTNILLESAQFDPKAVRRGVRALGISTDSSYRFERKVDIEGVSSAAKKAAELITKLCGGKIISYQAQGIKESKTKGKKIKLSIEKCERVLGIKISIEKIRKIFSSLSFKLIRPTLAHGRPDLKLITVVIPSLRQDVNLEEDLIEEIARIYGYDKIPLSLPYVLPQAVIPSNLKYAARYNLDARIILKIRNILSASGFNEVIHYGLAPKAMLEKNKDEGGKFIEIENPLSREQEILRPDLFFGLLNTVAYNLNRKNTRLKLFELGRVFSLKAEGEPGENLALGLAVCGSLHPDWQDNAKRQVSFFDLKGCLIKILSGLGIDEVKFAAEKLPLFKPEASFVLRVKDRDIGVIGEVDSLISGNYDIKQKNIFLAQVCIDSIAEYFNPDKKFKPYSQFPSIRRDISLLLKKEIPYCRIKELIALCAKEGLSPETALLEQYSGKQVPEGLQNLLISLEYNSLERTLKDEEVDVLHKEIIARLTKALDAKIR